MVASATITNRRPSVPRSQHSAAYKIWHYRYDIRLRSTELRSFEDERQLGSVTTGNAEWDRALALGLVEVDYTVADMVLLHEEGIKFQLCRPEQVKDIYLMLQRHLEDWHRVLIENPNKMSVPIEDLRMIDSFCEDLYPKVRYYLKEVMVSTFFDRINKLANPYLKRQQAFDNKVEALAAPDYRSMIAPIVAQSNSRRRGPSWGA